MSREMIKTEIDWAGLMPKSWHFIQNRYLFNLHHDVVGDFWKDYQLLSLTTKGVKAKDINASGGKVPDSYDKYQKVNTGDMIFCLFDLDVSAVFSGLSELSGMITSAYDVAKPNHKYISDLYSRYWFQYVFSNRYYKIYSKNVRFTISADLFKGIKTPVPPLKEQELIGRFLEEKISKIDSLIQNQEKQIDEINKYWNSVVRYYVTKGITISSKFKESGLSWFGNIPEHWTIAQTKLLFNIIAGATPDSGASENWDGDIVWVTPADFKTEDIYVKNGRRNLSQKGFESCSTTLIPKNSIIFSKRAPVGLVAINTEELCTNQGCLSCVNKVELNTKYFYYQMSVLSEYYELFASGTTFKEISAQKFGAFRLLVPPITEQNKIVDFLDSKIDSLKSLIQIKQQKIEKLQEYKKSLIYEYVTGKKEV